ncbi:MAG: hypothetical protein UW21_C0012G0011 [Candidatus Woesebacteria bacterium GW2011_GWB1_44_11b]|uniref:Uncharacterized protein n=1 Tax=Candidatus Woesebacteria bacterium GW2011_GWB1_44_11b TaxID=1618580 RepID=A0A0G1GEM7_9BACT|nr:MAG: hypothetical protein UW21_C0012G0011 [Candidatus Woesebacteria bacterium GW2011_GWB1_44_11b]
MGKVLQNAFDLEPFRFSLNQFWRSEGNVVGPFQRERRDILHSIASYKFFYEHLDFGFVYRFDEHLVTVAEFDEPFQVRRQIVRESADIFAVKGDDGNFVAVG